MIFSASSGVFGLAWHFEHRQYRKSLVLPLGPPQAFGSFGVNIPITAGAPPHIKHESPGHGFFKSGRLIDYSPKEK
jgi:hypothetical protein